VIIPAGGGVPMRQNVDYQSGRRNGVAISETIDDDAS
jgi:hypothetical protein